MLLTSWMAVALDPVDQARAEPLFVDSLSSFEKYKRYFGYSPSVTQAIA